MGFFIDGPGVPKTGKGEYLVSVYYATEIGEPSEWVEDLVCVVENDTFDAAGYIYDAEELKRAIGSDDRPKRWFIVKHAAALSGYIKSRRF